MQTNIKRRIFLQRSFTAGTVCVATAAGLLSPGAVLAAWPETAFAAKDVEGALSSLTGSSATKVDAGISIRAPDIAENGAVVPVTVDTERAAESITIIASTNPAPLIASFELGPGTGGMVSTRIKMGKTGDVVAIVKSGGKLYSNKKPVKVTIGGCGG